VPRSQVVRNEEPASPGDVVGLPQGTVTGPTIYLFAVGPWVGVRPLRLVSAHIRGSGGLVALRLVEPARHPKIAPFVPLGVFFLIPVRPLAPGTTYRASATIAGAGDTVTKTWSFRTA
jgi:hypothetical protein